MTINLTGGYTNYASHGAGEAPRSENNVSGPVSGNFQQMSGGVLRYSMAAEDPGAVVENYQPEAVRANVGAVYRSGADGASVMPAYASYIANEPAGGATGILATARNNFGRLVTPSEITPTTLVRYGQSETQAQVLERMGVLGRDGNGRYYEIQSAQNTPASGYQQPQVEQQTPQASTPTENDFTVELFPQEIEDSLARAIDPIPQPMYQAALAKILEGTMGEHDYQEIARLSGIPVEDARERAQFVERAFQAQADSLARRAGCDPQELWDWAQQEKPEAFSRARQELVFGRNTGPMRALATEFFRSTPPTIEALQKAGYEISKTPAGKTVVKVRGSWISPETAAKIGWL